MMKIVQMHYIHYNLNGVFTQLPLRSRQSYNLPMAGALQKTPVASGRIFVTFSSGEIRKQLFCPNLCLCLCLCIYLLSWSLSSPALRKYMVCTLYHLYGLKRQAVEER